MKERIREIRKSLMPKCSQEKFAHYLGTTRNAIKTYELGTVVPSDTFIKLLCSKFNISEEWLRTGNGKMHNDTEETLVNALIEKYHMSENQKRLMLAFLEMDEEKRERVATAFFDLVHQLRAPKVTYPKTEEQSSELDVDKEVSEYRAELVAERNGASYPSDTGSDDTTGKKNA